MTRINVVDPVVLTDQHLMAEYRELPMVMGSLRRSLSSKNGLPKIPDKYTLNAGHVTFFYNKGAWLKRRYAALVEELVSRGYNLDQSRVADFSIFSKFLDNDWSADTDAVNINSARITERILSKLHWYKYCSEPVVKLQSDADFIIRPTLLWK